LLCELWRDLAERGGIEVRPLLRLLRPLADIHGLHRVGELVRQRLARLDPETVALLELAAVAGPQFELRLLTQAAGTESAALAAALEEAVRCGMIEELATPAFAHRFGHELVRRAVYDRLTAVRRAQLHARVAETLEAIHAPDPSRILPDLAHHFTLAAPVLGPDRAVAYNLQAADAATESATLDLAADCLTRALELGIPDPHERARIQLELASMLSETGRRPEARTLLAESMETATALGAQDIAATARVLTARMQLFNAEVDPEEFRVVAVEAIETFTACADERGLSRAWFLVNHVELRQGRLTESLAACEHALEHAVAAGDQTLRRGAIASLVYKLTRGPVPVTAAISRCEELIGSNSGDRALEAVVTRALAALAAMDARFDEARDLLEQSSPILEELGQAQLTTTSRSDAAVALELCGDRAGAEHQLEASWREHAAHRSDGKPQAAAMGSAYQLALLYCDEGWWDDAERCLEYGQEIPVPVSYRAEAVLGLAARARVAAHRGDLDEALSLARRGVELFGGSDALALHAQLWLTVAEVLRARGEKAAEETAVGRALELYERKGNIAAVARLRAAESAPTG
jgi:predicted ATPase